MLDLILEQVERSSDIMTKSQFGTLVHSDDEREVEKALAIMEAAGGYENLED